MRHTALSHARRLLPSSEHTGTRHASQRPLGAEHFCHRPSPKQYEWLCTQWEQEPGLALQQRSGDRQQVLYVRTYQAALW